MFRAAGAVLLAAAAVVALQYGGVAWRTALPAAAGAALFVLWRTIPGVASGFACFALAAVITWLPGRAALPVATARLVPMLVLFEVLGLVTIAIVAWIHQPRRVSRRLLGCWLGSSGIIILGLALCTVPATLGTGSVLVTGGLAYRLGTVPAYAWAPLLVRHPAWPVTILGLACLALAGGVLLVALPCLPAPHAAATALSVLCAVTTPWSVWHAAKQWRKDRHCALSYSAVAALSGILLAAFGRARA